MMPLDSDSPITDQAMSALQEENRRLRDALQEAETQGQRGVSRRGLLAGGATVLAASAGAGVFTPLKDASAAPQRQAATAGLATIGASGLPLQFYLQIVGSKQGVIAGDVNGDGLADVIGGLKYDHSIVVPRDAQTGQPTGRRQHQPVTIVKQIDRASPLLFQALVTNENLTSVTASFRGRLGLGAFGVVYKVALTNALIVNMEQMVGDVANEEETSPHELEIISFVYRKITWTWVQGSKSATDDWLSPA